MRARDGDLMPETIPPVGLLIVRSDPGNPGVRTFDFDRMDSYANWEKLDAELLFILTLHGTGANSN